MAVCCSLVSTKALNGVLQNRNACCVRAVA